jgi:hypothetical protein
MRGHALRPGQAAKRVAAMRGGVVGLALKPALLMLDTGERGISRQTAQHR